MTDIILASKSPRRKKILEKTNLKFKILNSEFDESKINFNDFTPSSYAICLANKKCLNVSNINKNSLVIGADTVVIAKNKILNKPSNKEEAINHLKFLSNNSHEVYTGVSIILESKKIKLSFFEKTIVNFYKINEKEIIYYVENYKPYDKSGAYGIQDYSMIFVKNIEGCFNNVIGFPVSKFYKLCSMNSTIYKIIESNKNG